MLLAALLAGAWLGLRDLSLFAVREVEVTGASGPEAPRIRAALETAARDMTTLHVRRGELDASVEGFPVVRDLEVDARPLHALTIRVVPYRPVGALVAGARRIPVAADGTVLPADVAGPGLTAIPADAVPEGRRVTAGRAALFIRLLAAAPEALRGRIASVAVERRGYVARLTDGPDLVFGTPTRLGPKWSAALAVLAAPASAGAGYVDVSAPDRPVAGPSAPGRTAPQAPPGAGSRALPNPQPKPDP